MRRPNLKQLCSIAFLLLFSSLAYAQEEYRPLLIKNATALGITSEDAANAVITHGYTDKVTRITYVYLQQSIQQIKVYNTIITAAFINDQLQYTSGTFVKDVGTKAAARAGTISYMDAVRGAIHHLQLNENTTFAQTKDLFATENKYTVAANEITEQPIEATLYWTPAEDKKSITLAWNVNVRVKGTPDWWNVRMNAHTGEFIQKDNLTVSEQPIDAVYSEKQASVTINTFKNTSVVSSASYQVIPFPYESPRHGSFAVESDPWLKVHVRPEATTLGWHSDNFVNYDITRGNNVFAFLDRRANGTPDAVRNWPDTSLTPAPNLSFIHNINTSQQPWRNTENKKAALDNLFYWSNLLHDISYQYGFTEAAGNFQRDNLGRGGYGNDPVMARAQDSAGLNNAYFTVPPDGGSGIMQMYNWTTPISFEVLSPSPIAGIYSSREPTFSAFNRLADNGGVTGRIVWYNDDLTDTVHHACMPPTNPDVVTGNIVMIDALPGNGCTSFASKIKNAQNAGAIGVIIYSANSSWPNVGGSDATIVIPVIGVLSTTGSIIADRLNANEVVTATMRPGIYIDSDFDNGIISHEYGHGISCRLTGGPFGSACLNNAEQAGEGWSDYIALMMTTNWATAQLSDGAKLRGVGAYAANQPINGGSLRRYSYSTNMSVNPLTYANMASNTEVHATGEIWCSALWDMTWNIIQQHNAITPDLFNSTETGGNIIAMNLVITGMKLQPCSPGFLDARNAILAADSILYGYQHKCAIWNAFARRGMGYSAVQGLSTSATDQTAAFDLPSGVTISRSAPLIIAANSDHTITRTVSCNCQPVSFVLRDTIPAGFTYVNSTPAGVLNGNVLTYPSISETTEFSLTLKTPADACAIDTVINDNRDNATTGGFVASGSALWTASTVLAHSGNTSWYAPNRYTSSSAVLTSGSTASTLTKPLSVLSFWHNFRTETLNDGGVLEYSVNGGSTWLDAGHLFLSNGYNTTMSANSILNGRKAFSGNSRGFELTTLDLSSFGTTPVQFRFWLENNANGIGVDGWYVDDIARANGCGGILRSGVYNGAGVWMDGTATPLFVKPAVMAVKEKTGMILMPNPVNTEATLYISKAIKARFVNVYSLTGKLVQQIPVGAGAQQVKITTSGLTPGVYIIETIGGKKEVTRMIVQH